jgi:hypothetical protein
MPHNRHVLWHMLSRVKAAKFHFDPGNVRRIRLEIQFGMFFGTLSRHPHDLFALIDDVVPKANPNQVI